jgi:hypothetical protein
MAPRRHADRTRLQGVFAQPQAADPEGRSRAQQIARVLERNRVRRKEARDILAVLQQPAVVTSPGTTEAAAAHVTALLASIRLAKRLEKEAKAHIEGITDRLVGAISDGSESASDACQSKSEQKVTPNDAAILLSFPGIGRLNLATLLCEGSEGVRARDYDALRCQGGVAPVTKQSEKGRYVVQRRACSKRLANALLHWARVAVQHDQASRAKYQALRARGKSWPRALRAVADRLLYLACAALRSGTLYNPELVSKKNRLLIGRKSETRHTSGPEHLQQCDRWFT